MKMITMNNSFPYDMSTIQDTFNKDFFMYYLVNGYKGKIDLYFDDKIIKSYKAGIQFRLTLEGHQEPVVFSPQHILTHQERHILLNQETEKLFNLVNDMNEEEFTSNFKFHRITFYKEIANMKNIKCISLNVSEFINSLISIESLMKGAVK